MNFLFSGLPLGRFFGIQVVVSWLFFIFAAFNLMSASDKLFSAIFYIFLFGIVLLHEFGHALACKAVGGRAPLIVLWPLGGLAFCQPPDRPVPHLITTICGPLVNVVLFGLTYLLTFFFDVTVWPDLAQLFVLAMLRVNLFLLLFNILPVYPMDGGRILQELLWLFIGYPRSLIVAGMIGTVAGGMLAVIGFGLVKISLPGIYGQILGGTSSMLGFIGIMAAFESFNAYRRGQELLRIRR